MHGDRAPRKKIDPAAIGKAHLERRWNGQQPPAVAHVDQHAQTARARDVVRVARDGKELVKRCVSDGQLRGEHAMHPACGAKRRLVWQHGLARPQKRAVAARHEPLLVPEHDVAVVRRIGREEGKEPFVRRSS